MGVGKFPLQHGDVGYWVIYCPQPFTLVISSMVVSNKKIITYDSKYEKSVRFPPPNIQSKVTLLWYSDCSDHTKEAGANGKILRGVDMIQMDRHAFYNHFIISGLHESVSSLDVADLSWPHTKTRTAFVPAVFCEGDLRVYYT